MNEHINPLMHGTPATMEPRLSILAEAMESLPYAVAIADARQTDAPIVYANAAFSTLTGYPCDELLGRNCRLLQGPCSDRTKVAALRTAVALGLEGQITLLNYRKDGTLFWNRVRIKPLHDSAGQLTHFVSTHSDISSDAADHDAATRKSPLLTKFAVQLPGALFTLEQKADGKINCRFIGAQAHAILGQSPLDPNGREPLLAALGEAEHNRLLSTLASSARDMSPWRQEFRIHRHEPEPHWLEINATPESLGDGNVAWYGYLSDITQRKRLENELRLAASVFDNAQGAVVITDANGIVLEVNPIFSEVTGYSRDEIVGRTPALLNSGRHSPSFYREMWQALQQAGYWRGEIWNKRKDGELYAELLTITGVRDSAGQISHYVGTFTDVTLLREHQSRLRDLAYHDPLTHLPNRTLLQDRISQALASAGRSGRRLAVCYLDLDNFKPINDALGHACGDQLLIQVAARLQGSLREGDTVARLGGDEFVLLLPNLADHWECRTVLGRVIEDLTQPYLLEGHAAQITASVGIALYPDDESDSDALIRHADQAMYLAKRGGRNRLQFFDTEQEQHLRERQAIIARIRKALEADQFRLYYQPKVNLRQGRVVGVEALARWQHPELGLLAPKDFLPLIEESDLSVAFGEWVLKTALGQLVEWQNQGLNLDVSININISPRHLLSGDFESELSALLQKYPQLNPRQLELEVLESTDVADPTRAREVIQACRNLGVTVALDDFGTGYSSLQYLKQFPVDTLKIDQTFIRDMLDDPEDMTIVEGVLSLATVFRMEVVAEGVETLAHGLALIYLGCDLAQGYAIARPMPAEKLPTWVDTWTPDAQWSAACQSSLDQADLPILLAGLLHQREFDSVRRTLDRGTSLPDRHSHDDPRGCHFKRWMESRGVYRYQGLREFTETNHAHREADQLIECVRHTYQNGQSGMARRLFAQLEQAQNRLESSLGQLTQALKSISGQNNRGTPPA